MLINSLETNSPDISFMTSSTLQILEDNLFLFKNDPLNRILQVSNFQNIKYLGDFYGLLTDLRINKSFHYLTLRVNDLKNSTLYMGDKDIIIHPNVEEFRLLIQMDNVTIL